MASSFVGFWKCADRWTQRILRFFTITVFLGLGLLMFSNVALRVSNDLTGYLARHGMEGAAAMIKSLLPIGSFHWFDEIVELCFAYLVFYGAAAIWGTKGHFSVGDWISGLLPGERTRAFYRTLVALVSAAFMAIFFWFSLRLSMRTTELTTVFQMPKWVLYSCMPVSSFIMMMYSVADVWVNAGRLIGKIHASK
ncbi:hypothetical protein FACS1894187_01200 [Synergistales bacterium]|nr:hypothetical protein FACS1894187_01200 [Synergistales bacterium]